MPYLTAEAAGRRGPVRRDDGLRPPRRRPGPRLDPRRRTRRWAPTASASPTPARRPVVTSRSTARRRWCACSSSSRAPARWLPRRPRRRSSATACTTSRPARPATPAATADLTHDDDGPGTPPGVRRRRRVGCGVRCRGSSARRARRSRASSPLRSATARWFGYRSSAAMCCLASSGRPASMEASTSWRATSGSCSRGRQWPTPSPSASTGMPASRRRASASTSALPDGSRSAAVVSRRSVPSWSSCDRQAGHLDERVPGARVPGELLAERPDGQVGGALPLACRWSRRRAGRGRDWPRRPGDGRSPRGPRRPARCSGRR